MTAVSARTMKEARAVFYPWCGVTLLCALPMILGLASSRAFYGSSGPDPLTSMLFQVGLFMGIPLLASLSYGNEFRYKTLDLLVSQPVNRSKIWREKWIVTSVAVLTTALIATLSSRIQYPMMLLVNADFLLYLILISCSAPFWTLVGKSTLGGFVLNIAALVPLFSVKASLELWNAKSQFIDHSILIAAMWAAAWIYSGFMLWLGRWMLVHRQSSGSLAGADVMEAIPLMLPANIAALFRCRPHQVILNLFRKEVRLLRPLWLFTALYIVGWSALAFSSSFVPAVEGKRHAIYLGLVGVRATYTIIALLLAASLAHGEERNFGVQSWHLVLPISIRTQWLIRLVSATIAAVLCTIAVPAILMALARNVLQPEIMKGLEFLPFLESTPVLVLFFLFAFWCATVARDLIRTAGLMAAAGVLYGVTVGGSLWITVQMIPWMVQLRWFIISWLQLDPGGLGSPLGWFPDLSRHFVGLAIAFCAVMTIQTYSLFRRLPQDGAAKFLRPLIPFLAAMAILVSMDTVRSWKYGWGTISDLFYEVEAAIVKLPPDTTYNQEDLAKVSVLHDRTQRWLRTSSMTLTVSDYRPSGSQKVFSGDLKNQGILTIQFPGGMTCNSTFLFSQDKSPKVAGNSITCK